MKLEKGHIPHDEGPAPELGVQDDVLHRDQGSLQGLQLGGAQDH